MNLNVRDAERPAAVREPVHPLRRHAQGQPAELRGGGATEEAEALYERVRDALGAQGGAFGARMQVELETTAL